MKSTLRHAYRMSMIALLIPVLALLTLTWKVRAAVQSRK